MNEDQTKEEKDAIAKAMSIMGKRRAQKLTPERRQAIARLASKAAWAKIPEDKALRSQMMSERRLKGWQRIKKQDPTKDKQD
jgi:hypothetical protein